MDKDTLIELFDDIRTDAEAALHLLEGPHLSQQLQSMLQSILSSCKALQSELEKE